MNTQLLIAGLLCVGMAFAHAVIGLIWVLPHVTEERLPKTPFGPPSLTLAMVRVTWYIVTMLVLVVAVLLMTIASDGSFEPTTLLLRVVAAMWLAAAGMAFWFVRRHPRHLLRLPVPLLWVVVAVLCWTATV